MMEPQPKPMASVNAIMAASLASGLRHKDPVHVANCASRLVDALDRGGFAIETVVANAVSAPIVHSMKPGSRQPMGQYNWPSWVRHMLLSPLLTEWEDKFLRQVMRQNTPSKLQKQKLWEILRKVYPAGCGRWGKRN
uniref:Uncharacterized protein n=1 Tax=viral metagenome TaxID=1070528 RepID=A0A6H1ZSB9_9ZZZZ